MAACRRATSRCAILSAFWAEAVTQKIDNKKIRNPKFEARNKFEPRNSNAPNVTSRNFSSLFIWIVSDFAIRVSDFASSWSKRTDLDRRVRFLRVHITALGG